MEKIELSGKFLDLHYEISSLIRQEGNSLSDVIDFLGGEMLKLLVVHGADEEDIRVFCRNLISCFNELLSEFEEQFYSKE